MLYMKKSYAIKSFVSLAVSFCFVFMQAAFAFGFSSVRVAKNNTDFAIRSADIINSYNTSKNKNQPDSAGEMLRIIGRTSVKNYSFAGFGASAAVVGTDGRFLLQFSNKNAFDKCLAYLDSDPEIEYAEKDRIVYTCASEGEETADLSWGVDALKVDGYAESIQPSDGASVTVAVVDSGVAAVDFVKDKLIEGYDFVKNEKGGAIDESVDSHGTFLASIITDCVKNAPVNIMPVRVLYSRTGSLANAVNGIYYATDNGADVINVSLGGVLNNCKSLDNALAYADSKNASVVVCAGNSKSDIYNYCPAHNESAITVTAVDESLVFAADFMPDSGSEYGSNYGSAVDVCAPGVNITGYGADGNTKILNGTSMSAAFISACAALFRLEYPGCNTYQIQQAIKDSCTDLGTAGFDVYYGYGLPEMSKITYVEIRITDVKIKSYPQKTVYTYKVDENINLSGLALEVTYSDGSVVTVSDTSLMSVTGYSSTTAGDQTVTVEYEGFTVQYGVRVEYVWWQWIIRILLLGFLWY